MDFIKFTERRNAGLLTSTKFNNLFQYELLKKIHSSGDNGLIHNRFSSHAKDFSLLGNRLLVANSNLMVSLYDVSRPVKSGYKCLKTWNIQNSLRAGLESINWNPEGNFFTFSARDNCLYVVDIEHMMEIDKVEISGTRRIFQHRQSPHNPEMVAVASPLPKVVLVDLKSGNLTCTAPFHPRGVLSVSWCGLTENLLATAGDNGLLFWDVRQFSKPLFVNGDNCTPSGILPNFEIIPSTDKIVILNSDRTLTVWDAFKFQKISHVGTFNTLNIDRRVRYKFYFSGTSEPGLLFMPDRHNISVFDFKAMDPICVLQLGHVMPVEILCFNNSLHQLYSSSLDGSLAWVPKPLQCWTNFIPDNE